MQNRQGERRSLAGAGLGAANQVFALEHERNGAQLDGRRLDIAHRPDAVHQRTGKTKFRERHGPTLVRPDEGSEGNLEPCPGEDHWKWVSLSEWRLSLIAAAQLPVAPAIDAPNQTLAPLRHSPGQQPA